MNGVQLPGCWFGRLPLWPVIPTAAPQESVSAERSSSAKWRDPENVSPHVAAAGNSRKNWRTIFFGGPNIAAVLKDDRDNVWEEGCMVDDASSRSLHFAPKILEADKGFEALRSS